jgi:hypothetical protein
VADRCSVASMVENLAENDFRFQSLVDSIVTSPAFMFQESGQ